LHTATAGELNELVFILPITDRWQAVIEGKMQKRLRGLIKKAKQIYKLLLAIYSFNPSVKAKQLQLQHYNYSINMTNKICNTKVEARTIFQTDMNQVVK
jgi:hypothetical protein